MRHAITMALVLVLTGCAGSPQKPPQIERITGEALERLLPKPTPNLTTDEIVQLSKQGASPEAIIDKIRQSGSSYALLPSQYIDLAGRGVDPKVLDFMQSAHEQSLRDGCAEEINKREQAHRAECDALRQQLLSRPYCPYDPFWGPYPPYWRLPYPYWR
jgi:hypothetical protein